MYTDIARAEEKEYDTKVYSPRLPRDGTMDRVTFDKTIRAFKYRKPFQPFTVAIVDGDRVEVDHPDALVFRDGVAIFAAPGGVPVIIDHESVSQDLADRPSA